MNSTAPLADLDISPLDVPRLNDLHLYLQVAGDECVTVHPAVVVDGDNIIDQVPVRARGNGGRSLTRLGRQAADGLDRDS